MKIAIVSDVHGNYPALASVIDDALFNKVDKFVFIGDYIFDLPFSNDVTEKLMKLENAYVITGNKETYLKWLSQQDQRQWVYDQMGAIYQTYRELSGESIAFLMNLKENCVISLDCGKLLYATHYLHEFRAQDKTKCSSYAFHKKMRKSPFSHQEFLEEFQKDINQDEYKRIFHTVNASVIVFGHDHLQRHGYCAGKLIINPGSCGQPLDFDNRAAYTILEETSNGFHVTEKRVEYDVSSVIDVAKKSEMYKKGRVWCELVFLSLKTGKDYFGMLFEIANKIAASKSEAGNFFTNETWKQAYEHLEKNFEQYTCMEAKTEVRTI